MQKLTSMSKDANSQPYLFSVLDHQDQATGCSSMTTPHEIVSFSEIGALGLASECSDSSSQDPSASPHSDGKLAHSLHEDVEMKSSGSSGSGTESQGNESHGNESHGNSSSGNESTGSSASNSKDSVLLESSVSNKSLNSHSLSPPSSSNAFSLLSTGSELDNPSTSGCSSEESAKAKTQKELLKTLKELKLHLPADKKNRGSKSTTLNTLKYALRCVKQVEANEEYYQLLMTSDSHPSELDVSSYTIEEIDSITSEYTQKSTDVFAVAVSLITGKIVYISGQAASILNCKRQVFRNAKFVEFLSPQDVSVFYSFTTPYRLPSWGMCTGAESSPSDCMQEKSFFCRISGGKECAGDLQYYPFRMTPYLMKVQDTEQTEDQFCCLLLAERVHSGYEAPRIPTDKRIFTTTHTPSCVFQDVDERAVLLLGYLPQDLIGTSILLHLHPNDRPLMLSIHRKILQFSGQPFDHSSIRFCARNGEYITLDTSWSSFVNPWSRKVSFVIARHKVRMGPVNEDVFAAPSTAEVKAVDSDIQDITEQIHRLLLQPVHNNNNNTNSHGSLSSKDHLMSMASSDSNKSEVRPHADEEEDQAKPRTFQEVCKGVHMQKNQVQQFKKSPGTELLQKNPVVRPKDSACPVNWRESTEGQQITFQEELALKDHTVHSYQQISCLDSVIRYLESCNVPITAKRKCQSSSNTTSSNSDEDKQKASESAAQVAEEPGRLKSPAGHSPLDVSKSSSSGVVGTSLTSLALPSKAESVVSVTSQCSYSSTIVHVGDKKLQPESEIIEDVPSLGDTAEGPIPATSSATVLPSSQERKAYKKLGLTKQVLAAHTQKEEQAFLNHFKELRGVHMFKTDCLEKHKGQDASNAGPSRVCKQGERAEPAPGRRGTSKKFKSKRIKQNESSDSNISNRRQQELFKQELQGLNQTAWSLSDTSQSALPLAYPAVVPAYPLQAYPGTSAMSPRVQAPLTGFGDSQCTQTPRLPMQPQFPTPIVTAVMALMFPNYMSPQQGSAPRQPFYPEQALFPPSQGLFHLQTVPVLHSMTPFTPQNHFPVYPFPFTPLNKQPKPAKPDPGQGPSRNSSPQSPVGQDQSSPLFQSRCSSPLQLNILQLEESQRPNERQESTATSAGTQESTAVETEAKGRDKVQEQADAFSSSSDLMDILLLEDSRSGTGSATSGFMGSAFNGCGTSVYESGASASGIGSSHTSSNSRNYFGSVDSSQKSLEPKRPVGGASGSLVLEESDSLIKYVLQDPLWLLAATVDKAVMTTYQLPSRDIQQVLQDDQEKLRQMQKSQPLFTEEQKKELAEVHPWVRRGGLPKAINVKACIGCKGVTEALVEEELPDLHMGESEVSDVTALAHGQT